MKTAHELIRDILDRLAVDICREPTITIHARTSNALHFLEYALLETFGWHPIEHVDAFGLRTVPKGKMWGPRLVAIVEGENVAASPHIVYWDPDTVQPDGRPVTHPEPYWRTVGMTAGWSRRNQPTHFIRPYAPHFER